MGSNIHEIKPEPNQKIIKMIESLLKDAKDGKIQSLAFAGINNDATTFNCFECSWYPVGLLGELRILERDVMDLNISLRRQVAWEYTE